MAKLKKLKHIFQALASLVVPLIMVGFLVLGALLELIEHLAEKTKKRGKKS